MLCDLTGASLMSVLNLVCNRRVEDTILKIIRQRKADCLYYHHYEPDQAKYCQKEVNDYETAEANWFAKCK